jgi:hypothetical protein
VQVGPSRGGPVSSPTRHPRRVSVRSRARGYSIHSAMNRIQERDVLMLFGLLTDQVLTTTQIVELQLSSFGVESRLSLQLVPELLNPAKPPGRIGERVRGRIHVRIRGRPMTRPPGRRRIPRSQTTPGERVDSPTRYVTRTLPRPRSSASMLHFTSRTTRRDLHLCLDLYEYRVLTTHQVFRLTFPGMGSRFSPTQWAAHFPSGSSRQKS